MLHQVIEHANKLASSSKLVSKVSTMQSTNQTKLFCFGAKLLLLLLQDQRSRRRRYFDDDGLGGIWKLQTAERRGRPRVYSRTDGHSSKKGADSRALPPSYDGWQKQHRPRACKLLQCRIKYSSSDPSSSSSFSFCHGFNEH